MATVLQPADYLHHLACPHCAAPGLQVDGAGSIRCDGCGSRYPVSEDGIIEFVDPTALSGQVADELQGNTYNLSSERIAAIMAAERVAGWRTYYARQRRRSMQQLAQYMQELPVAEIVSLGTGSGREIAYLMDLLPLRTVYCSDLSLTALRMVPERLKDADIQLGLFTSDLGRCPLWSRDVPILVVAALHHTEDMHATLERLLAHGYHDVLVVEPTSNALLQLLARRGLAHRVEYSGLHPGRLNHKALRAMAQQHGYRLSLTTLWVFPEDYFRRLNSRGRLSPQVFCAALDAFSMATNTIKLGNFSVAHLQHAG